MARKILGYDGLQTYDSNIKEYIGVKTANVDNAVLTTAQELTDEQRAQARANISEYDWRTVTNSLGSTYEIACVEGVVDCDAAVEYNSSSTGYNCFGMMMLALVGIENYASSTRLKRIKNNFYPYYKELSDAGLINTNLKIYLKSYYDDSIQYIFTINKYNDTAYGISTKNLYTSNDGTLLYNPDTESLDSDSVKLQYADTTFSVEHRYADAKAVGDALALKADSDHNHDDVYYTEVEIDEKLEGKKPVDFVAKITGDIINGYTCDVPFADLWATHDAGRDVVFNIADMIFTNADFVITASQSDSEVKQVRIMFLNGESGQLYIIGEDDTVSRSNYNFITKSDIKQETGTAAKLPMSQKATTDALALKADLDHSHDDTYYTEVEIDEKLETVNTTLATKADSNHNHNDIYYTIEQIDSYEFITVDDIDEICGGVTEGGLPLSDVDELMAQLEEV